MDIINNNTLIRYSEYLFVNNFIVWAKLFLLSRDFYPYALANLVRYHNKIDHTRNVVWAVISNNLPIIQVLKYYLYMDDYNECIEFAVIHNNLDIIRILHPYNNTPNYNNALRIAVEYQNINIVKMIIMIYNDPVLNKRIVEHTYKRPFNIFNFHKLGQYPERKSADPSLDYSMALLFAIENYNHEIIDVLIEYLPVNQDLSKHITMVVKHNDLALVKLLNENNNKRNYISDVVYCLDRNYIKLADFLLAHNEQQHFDEIIAEVARTGKKFIIDKIIKYDYYDCYESILQKLADEDDIRAINIILPHCTNYDYDSIIERGIVQNKLQIIEIFAPINNNKRYRPLINLAKTKGYIQIATYLEQYAVN